MQSPPPLIADNPNQQSGSNVGPQDTSPQEDKTDSGPQRQHRRAADHHDSNHQVLHTVQELNSHAKQNGHTLPSRALLGTAPGDMFASRSSQLKLQHRSSGSAQHSPSHHTTSSNQEQDGSQGHSGPRHKPVSKQAATKTGLPALTAAGQRLEELQAMQKAKDDHKRQQRAMLAGDKHSSRRLLHTESNLDSNGHRHHVHKHASNRHPHTVSCRNLQVPSRHRLAQPSEAQPYDDLSRADLGMSTLYSHDSQDFGERLDEQSAAQGSAQKEKEALFFTGLSEVQSGSGNANPLLASLDHIHDTGFSDFEVPQQHRGALDSLPAVHAAAGSQADQHVSRTSLHCLPHLAQTLLAWLSLQNLHMLHSMRSFLLQAIAHHTAQPCSLLISGLLG